MNETKFAKSVTDALESIGAFTFNVHGHRFQKSGWPDMYCAHPKWTGWCEFKVEKGKPTALQMQVMRGLLGRGVPAFVVRLREGSVYCELWHRNGFETLAYCHEWHRFKGTARGLNLVDMLVRAGDKAIEIIKGVPK
jgi:hypothetical protein